MYCVLCEQPIYMFPDNLMRIPFIGSFDSTYADELMSLMGQDMHAACWAKHPLWPEFAGLAVKQHMADFQKDKMEPELIANKFRLIFRVI